MNKETIYIEPSDDITNILSKIKSSEKKIIALVPPKKASVLLSSVNIKLIARAAKTEKKAVVLVTTDDSLTKLAMSANLPVAPSLKSRPILPHGESEESKELEEESPKAKIGDFVEEPEASKLAEDYDEADDEGIGEDEGVDDDVIDNKKSIEKDDEDDEDDEDDNDDEEEIEKEAKKPKKALKEKASAAKADDDSSKSKKEEPKSPFLRWVVNHRLWVIFGLVFIVSVGGFLIWALIFAPRVDISIKVRTTTGNFAENVTITKVAGEEKVEDGIFYGQTERVEDEQSIKFTATGQKDNGESATGSLVVYYQSKDPYAFNFDAGSSFSINGLEYNSVSSGSLSWGGSSIKECDNKDDYEADKGCLKSITLSVKASAPGDKYNITGRQSNWKSGAYPSVSVYNSTDMTGGTSDIITIVQQSDVDLALDKLKSENQDNGKANLLKRLSSTVLPIDASFKVETTDPVVTPAVGAEVPEGTTPSVSSKTTYTIMTIERAHVEEFIKARAKLEEGRKLYSYGDPFIEYFTQTNDNTYSAKLKTTYKYGPEISESEILDKIRGKKIGRIEPELKSDYSGISSVAISKSFFWVNTVPNDPNKITIKLEVEE